MNHAPFGDFYLSYDSILDGDVSYKSRKQQFDYEENIKKYFGVVSHIVNTSYEGNTYNGIVPMILMNS